MYSAYYVAEAELTRHFPTLARCATHCAQAAEPHARGQAAYARHVALQLFDAFLETEERFPGGAGAPTEQEVIDSLRRVREASQKYSSSVSPKTCNAPTGQEVLDSLRRVAVLGIVVSHQDPIPISLLPFPRSMLTS